MCHQIGTNFATMEQTRCPCGLLTCRPQQYIWFLYPRRNPHRDVTLRDYRRTTRNDTKTLENKRNTEDERKTLEWPGRLDRIRCRVFPDDPKRVKTLSPRLVPQIRQRVETPVVFPASRSARANRSRIHPRHNRRHCRIPSTRSGPSNTRL